MKTLPKTRWNNMQRYAMNFTDDEKLMLFLIWWYCDQDFPSSVIENYFDRISLLHEIAYNGGFQKFLSEAHEAEESYEFWVSDAGLASIKDNFIYGFCPCIRKTELFKNKITIVIN